MRPSQIAARFGMPRSVVSLIYWLRWRARVSPRAEVELTSNITFGPGCVVSSFCKIKASEGPLSIGRDVEIATHCFVAAEAGGIEIGDDTMIGPFVTIVGNDYRYDRLDIPIRKQPKVSKGIRIGKGVWIGAGAVVLDGADIGDNAIVTPASVVSRRVPENAVVQGNPAVPIFTRR